MKYWRIATWLTITIVMLSACKNDNEGGANEPPPNPPPVQEDVVLSEALSQLSIWQIDDRGSEEIVSYKSGLPDGPIHLAYHAPEVIVRLTFKQGVQTNIEQLEQQLDVIGAEMEVSEGESPQSFVIAIRNIRDEAVLSLGDLDQIELARKNNHLQYMLNQSSLKVPYSLLIPGGADGRSHIFVSDQEDSVVLRFSEAMVRYEQPGTEWLSDTQLRIDLEESDGLLELGDYYSVDGNFSDRKYQSVMIHPTPSRSWLDAASGGNVGWSSRDTYYDVLLFSPDNNKYAGIVKLSDDEVGDGSYYGIVIEQKGQSPVILEHTVHTRPDAGDMPVEWLNNDTLLYLSAFDIWAYDLESGSSRQVMTQEDGVQTIAFQYDRTNGRVYVLTQTALQQNGQQYMRGNLNIYNSDMELIERTEVISDLWPATENGTMPLILAIHDDGYYMTTYRDGQIITDYRTDHGEDDYAPGRIVGAVDGGVYLAVAEGGAEKLSWWPKGGDLVPITPFPATSYMMFGGDLFAHREGEKNTYYGYSLSRDEWLEWSPNAGRDSWIPNQQTAYYRVTD